MQKNKKCPHCLKVKTLDMFYKSSRQSGGYQSYCKVCNLENLNRLYPKLDVDKRRVASRRTMLKSKYGISLEDYNNILNTQQGVCAICKEKETVRSNKLGNVDSLRVDHCHTTGKIRGLLCSRCNFGISNFRDRIGILVSATNYLLKSKQPLIHEELKLDKKISTGSNKKHLA